MAASSDIAHTLVNWLNSDVSKFEPIFNARYSEGQVKQSWLAKLSLLSVWTWIRNPELWFATDVGGI